MKRVKEDKGFPMRCVIKLTSDGPYASISTHFMMLEHELHSLISSRHEDAKTALSADVINAYTDSWWAFNEIRAWPLLYPWQEEMIAMLTEPNLIVDIASRRMT